MGTLNGNKYHERSIRKAVIKALLLVFIFDETYCDYKLSCTIKLESEASRNMLFVIKCFRQHSGHIARVVHVDEENN